MAWFYNPASPAGVWWYNCAELFFFFSSSWETLSTGSRIPICLSLYFATCPPLKSCSLDPDRNAASRKEQEWCMMGRAQRLKRSNGESREQVGPVLLCRVEVWAGTHLLTCMGGANIALTWLCVSVYVWEWVRDQSERSDRVGATGRERQRGRSTRERDTFVGSTVPSEMLKKKDNPLKGSGKISKWVFRSLSACLCECTCVTLPLLLLLVSRHLLHVSAPVVGLLCHCGCGGASLLTGFAHWFQVQSWPP